MTDGDDILWLRAKIKNARGDLLPDGGISMPKSITPGTVLVAVTTDQLERVLDELATRCQSCLPGSGDGVYCPECGGQIL